MPETIVVFNAQPLYQLAQSSRLGRPAPSPAQAARISIDAYQGILGPMPAAPLDTVLSAFAKFESPARDTEALKETDE